MSPDQSWQPRLEEAVGRFNESGAARTVAGLTRTLGSPRVSVGAGAGGRDQVRITVAWELSWYQWGIDLGAPVEAVCELASGSEMAQLDGGARVWNAGASRDGHLFLGDAEPVPPSRMSRLRRALT